MFKNCSWYHFSSPRNWDDCSILSVVPLHLLQSSFFNKSFANWLVSFRVPANFSREFRLLGLAKPFTILKIGFLLITSPAALNSILMFYNFFVKLSSKKVWSTSLFRSNILFDGVFEFAFHEFIVAQLKLYHILM